MKPLESTAREIVARGASLEAPRGIPLFKRPKPVPIEEALEALDQGDLLVRLPGIDTPQPVKNARDLTEVAVFQGLRPTSELESPQTGEDLQALSGCGWRFFDDSGKELGAYGAYNSLTDQKGVRTQNGVPLNTGRDLTALLDFSASRPEAQLEQEGFRFFDGEGRSRPAFMVKDDPRAQVGQDRPWWPVGATATLTQRVHDYAGVLKSTGDPAVAGRLLEQPFDGTVAHAQKLCEGLVGAQIGAMQSHLAHSMARSMSRNEYQRAAAALAPRANDGWRQPFLAALAEHPDGQNSGALALKLSALHDYNLSHAAFLAATSSPDDTARSFARALFGAHNSSLSKGASILLEAMAREDADCARAARWNPSNPEPLARGLALGGRLEDAAAKLAWDLPAQRRCLADLRTDAELGKLHAACTDSSVGNALFEEALRRPPVGTGAEVAAVGDRIYGRLSNMGSEEATRLAQGWLALLKTRPDTADLARQVESWGAANPDRVTRALLKNPHADAGAIARAGLMWDVPAQRRFLKSSGSDPRLVELHQRISESGVANAVFALALTQPAARTGAELAAQAREIYAQCPNPGSETSATLAAGWLQGLASFSDTAELAGTVASWKAGSPDRLVRAVVVNPAASVPDIAGRGLMWDLPAQARYLAAQPGGTTRELHRGITESSLGNAVFQAALAQPDCKSGAELAAVAQRIYAQCPNLGSDQAKLFANRFLEQLGKFPDSAATARAAQAWQASSPDRVARALSAHLSQGTDAVARAGLMWDLAAQRRHLQTQGGAMARIVLPIHQQVQESSVGNALFTAALDKPECKSGADLRALLAQVYAQCPNISGDTSPRLANEALRNLAAFPDTGPLARAALSWQVATPDRLVRAVVADKTGSVDQVARAGLIWDLPAQRRYLEQLADDPANGLAALALRAHAGVTESAAGNALFQATLDHPQGNDVVDLARRT